LLNRNLELISDLIVESVAETIKIMQEPSDKKIKEGSKMELVFKCKVRGNKRLTYQWYKDGTVLQGKDGTVLQGKEEGTLVIKTVTLPDFGRYKCVASCKDDSSIRVESSPAELDVMPCDGKSKYVTQSG